MVAKMVIIRVLNYQKKIGHKNENGELGALPRVGEAKTIQGHAAGSRLVGFL